MPTDNLLEISTAIIVTLALLGMPLVWLVDRASRRARRNEKDAPIARTRPVRRDASGNAVAVLAGWSVIFGVLVASQQNLVLSATIVIALTASLVGTVIVVYRSSGRLRSVPAKAA